MTHDELVRFAAGKVGGEVCNPTGSHTAVKIAYSQNITPPFSSGWTVYDLTSPELFLKGLGVIMENKYDFVVEPTGVGIRGTERCGPDDNFPLQAAYTPFEYATEIPLTFWQCWAELEGGQM